MTQEETRPQKRQRATNDEIQSRLIALYDLAYSKGKISIPSEQEDDNQDIIIIRCPFDKCDVSIGGGLKEPVQYSLIIESHDETSLTPLKFANTEQREKLTRHLRKVHREWYRDPRYANSECCTESSVQEREECLSLDNTGNEEDEEEEVQVEEAEEDDEPDMEINEDLDEITETEYRLPNKGQGLK